MKKFFKFLTLLGVIASVTVWNVKIMTNEVLLTQAAEDNEILIIEEDSQDDQSADVDNGVLGERESLSSEETGTEASTVEEDSVLELSIDEEKFIVPFESINRIEEDEYVFLESYVDKYVIWFTPEEKAGYALYFSEGVAREDVLLYGYDPDAAQVKGRIEEKEIILASDGSILVHMDGDLEYIIVLDHAEAYSEIGLGISRVEEEQMMQEAGTETGAGTDPDLESETETEILIDLGTEVGPETETEPETGTEAETEAEPETGTEAETETESETGTEAETEAGPETGTEAETETESEVENGVDAELPVTLKSADLLLDDGLEQVPVSLLSCLDGQEVVRVRLHYSDGSEQVLTGEMDSFGNSIQLSYEDTAGEDGSVSRVYTLKVIPAQEETGAVIEKSEIVVFRKDAEDKIENIPAEEKSSIRYHGKKNWILVQSVPEVTGKYTMESFGRSVKELYYCAEGQTGAVKAGTVFRLEKDVTYTFLLKLDK